MFASGASPVLVHDVPPQCRQGVGGRFSRASGGFGPPIANTLRVTSRPQLSDLKIPAFGFISEITVLPTVAVS